MAKPLDEWAELDARIADREKLARTFPCPQCGAAAGAQCRGLYGPEMTVCGRRYRLAVEADKVGAA
jgi:predicted RNA-binding Zn-ribbon protein involved in translation (DUF1610 family)